jgi:hypothetical protein
MGRGAGGGGRSGGNGNARSFSTDSPADAVRGADIMSGEQSGWERSLTPGEAEAIDLYTDSNFGDEINRYMRTGDTVELPVDEVSPVADKLNNALSRNKIAQDTETYRGMGEKTYQNLANMKVGDEGSWKSFQSVSLSQRYADWFRTGSAQSVRVIVSKGTQGAYISRLGSYGGEYEVLLNSGTRWKVVGKSGGIITIKTIP